MNSREKPLILLQTEASYPYGGGGISTWVHTLCTELEEEADFILFAVTGQPNVKLKYELPQNIRSIIHVPLWGVEQPADYYAPQRPFSVTLSAKIRTNDNDVIDSLFLPLFRDLMQGIFNGGHSSPYSEAEIIYGLWKFCTHFDYKTALSHRKVWAEFKHWIERSYPDDIMDLNVPEINLKHVTFALRWLYHFLMPVDVPLPDVEVTHSTLAGFPSIPSIVKRYEDGTPAVITDHGVWLRERLINIGKEKEFDYYTKRFLLDLSTFMSRAIYSIADQVSPVTKIHTKWETISGAEEEKIKPIYNGIDVDVFRPQPKPDETEGRPTVVAVAHIFPLKDIETMIRSCDIVRRQVPDVQYRVYGSMDIDKSYTQKCKALVEKLDLGDHFIFGGFHQNPSEVYNEGDVTVLSSISEGVPYTVLESMSCRRPVIATDVGGVREAIGEYGYLCKPGEPGELAQGIIEFLKDDERRIRLGRKARERILDNFTKERSVNAYLKDYTRWSSEKLRPLKNEINTESVKAIIQYIDG